MPTSISSNRRISRANFFLGRGRRAVTLIEIMVAIAIASIVVAAALPRLQMGQYRADAAMRVVQGALQQAQRNAIQRQHDVVVGFDAGSSSIRLLFDADNDRSPDSDERVVLVPLEEGNVFAAPAVGVRGMTSGAISGPGLLTIEGLPSIIFRRDGAASSELEVYVRSPGSASTDYRALTVTQSTGRVRQYRYRDGSWRTDGT